jgi:hypothetical protein
MRQHRGARCLAAVCACSAIAMDEVVPFVYISDEDHARVLCCAMKHLSLHAYTRTHV